MARRLPGHECGRQGGVGRWVAGETVDATRVLELASILGGTVLLKTNMVDARTLPNHPSIWDRPEDFQTSRPVQTKLKVHVGGLKASGPDI